MYFWFFKLKKWGKKTAETRRRNCAVLPQVSPAVNFIRKVWDRPDPSDRKADSGIRKQAWGKNGADG